MSAIHEMAKQLDAADDVKAEQEAHIQTLTVLAQAKVDLFMSEIKQDLLNAGTGTDQTVPIKKILDATQQTHAYSSSSASAISTTVNAAVADFVQGDKKSILDGVGALISSSVTALFGEGDADEQTMSKYYVLTEGQSIIRLDVRGWSRQVTGTALSKKVDKVSAFAATKSSADVTHLDYNTFLDLYQPLLFANTTDPLTEDQIEAEMNETKKIFDAFQAEQRAASGS